ncbi:MAG: SMC-Scp complex subunit ScpB [Alphaproteobacteria bacterium]|nr:MAG: SMC-Scp complex subunit ScpB [Alphaproteobacteria bacterium]
MADEHLRMIEALLFAASEPLAVEEIAARLPAGLPVDAYLARLEEDYRSRGVNLVRTGERYMFRTAPDLAFLLRREVEEPRKLSRAAVETLAIIAYHQPVTRAEIEEIRGVGLSKGTLDVLMAAGWVRICGRKRTPGRPLTYGTTDDFLAHFGLPSLDDLPGIDELKATGMLDGIDDLFAEAGAGMNADGETSVSTEDEDDATGS